jgi:hypothetical protein
VALADDDSLACECSILYSAVSRESVRSGSLLMRVSVTGLGWVCGPGLLPRMVWISAVMTLVWVASHYDGEASVWHAPYRVETL